MKETQRSTKTHSGTESELTLCPPRHQRRAYAYAMWAHSESFPLAAWRSRGWAAESIFHLTLHTAGFRLAPVLICKKGSICIHQDCLGSQEGLGLFQSQQTKRGAGEGGGRMPGGVRLAGKSQAGQRPMEWQEKRSLHQTIDCRGRGNILHQTGDLEPKGA